MRAKIILPHLVVVLLLGLGAYFYMKTDLAGRAREQLSSRLISTRVLFDRSEDLRSFELLSHTRGLVQIKELHDVFAPVGPLEGETAEQTAERAARTMLNRAVTAAEVYTELWEARAGKRPEIVAITNREGLALVRNTTPKACPTGQNLARFFPIVADALQGEAGYTIWSVDGSPFGGQAEGPKACKLMNSGLMELTAAPILLGDQVVGSVIAGFGLSNGVARQKSEIIGMGMAVLLGDEVYSSSFTSDEDRRNLEVALRQGDVRSLIGRTLASGRTSDIFEISISGEVYLAMVGAQHAAASSDRIVTLIMASLDDARAAAGNPEVILFFLGLALVLVLTAGFVLGHHFLKPIVAIEDALLRIINGDRTLRIDVHSSEVGGLGYRINQLIGALTGEADTPDDPADDNR